MIEHGVDDVLRHQQDNVGVVFRQLVLVGVFFLVPLGVVAPADDVVPGGHAPAQHAPQNRRFLAVFAVGIHAERRVFIFAGGFVVAAQQRRILRQRGRREQQEKNEDSGELSDCHMRGSF